MRPRARGGYGGHGSSLRDLPRLRSARRHRASSWDRSGGDRDYVVIAPGETIELCDLAGAGSINHIWMTFGPREMDAPLTPEGEQMLRRLVLRIFWDGEENPSVLSSEDGRGLNSIFHMPFASGTRIEVTSEMSEEEAILFYYVDYEAFEELGEDLGRFHACWRRENPADGLAEPGEPNMEFLAEGTNLDGAGNYLILEAEGRGHYVGCVMNVQSLRGTDEFDWYGEGDDMIFIDREAFPPHCTGPGPRTTSTWLGARPRPARRLTTASPCPVKRTRPVIFRARARQQAQRQRLLHRLLVPSASAPAAGAGAGRAAPAEAPLVNRPGRMDAA